MYLQQFLDSVQKSHHIIFGCQTEIVVARRNDGFAPWVPCIYIYDNNPYVYSNEYVQLLVRSRWDCMDYFLVFDDSLTQVIEESIQGRDHIEPGMVIWSMVLKIMWSKVRYLYLLRNPGKHIQDTMHETTDILACLPVGFEFPEFPGAPVLAVAESFYDQEFAQYEKLSATPQEIKNGIIELSVEGGMVAKIAVRCRGEKEMLNFVKRCSDYILRK